ncbi:TRAP transporter substrate-binding protein [Parvibium lacunae]|uniref:C4-dicarboxylate ABC transporter n=1 Tax=Parvibium lacunae TaxID=1888893 RepID=A0A368L8A2_9BURK|nr:TRAP transporter substrate-binding protein [Parvibium lacunae]RCS59837.1 C4-dicarboxylate ABC transporter [Parvibium lacunae]
MQYRSWFYTKRLQILAALNLSLVLLVGMQSSHAQQVTQWQFSTSYPEDNFHTANIKQFARELEIATNGKIKVEVFPNGTLIKQKEIFAGVKAGKAAGGEVILSSLANINQLFGVDSIPFLLFGYEDAKRLWQLSRAQIVKAMEQEGVVLLFSVPWPPQGLYSTKVISSIKDLQGSKIRTYNNATQRISELVKAQGVNVASADVQKYLQEKQVDALITSAATGLDIKAWETVKYFHPVNAWIPKNVVFVNRETFNKLTPEERSLVMKISQAAEERGWRASEEKNREFQAQLAAKGQKIIEPSAILYSEFRRLGETLTREWLKTAGQDGLTVLLQYEVERFNLPKGQKP